MRYFSIAVLLAAAGANLQADFSYTQTSQMTGGAIFNLMRTLGPLARGARDPIVSTVVVKGNRMATVSKDTTVVIDVDKETVTMINTEKKQYSVLTFAQMKQYQEQAMARAQKGKADSNIEFKVSAKATGQTKTVNGLNAKQIVVVMETGATDQKSGETAAMNIVMDTWVAPVPGYDEVKNLQLKMAQKMGYLNGTGMAQMVGAMQPQTLKGFAEMAKEMSKLDGVPVSQFTKMGGSTDPTPTAQSQQEKGPSVGAAAAGAALGRLGGIGGFGRKKNNDPPPQQAEQNAPPAEGSFMEMTTDMSSFSTAPVDAAQLDVPAGFKQVENPMAKGLK